MQKNGLCEPTLRKHRIFSELLQISIENILPCQWDHGNYCLARKDRNIPFSLPHSLHEIKSCYLTCIRHGNMTKTKSFHMYTVEVTEVIQASKQMLGLKLCNVRADFLSSQKLLAVIPLQKKSTMQELAANILMRIPIVKIICECFLP